MNSIKATPKEIYEALEQQKKLIEMRARLVNVLDKVNQTINSITVENLELTSTQIDNLEKKKKEDEVQPVIQYNAEQNEKRAEEINQQLIDLDVKFSTFNEEEEFEL